MRVAGWRSVSWAGLLLFTAVVLLACSSDDAGSDQPAAQQPAASGFQISSPNFTEIRPRIRIPIENTCYGDQVSPPLDWTNAPTDTKSFALSVADLDHSTGRWVLWVLYHIPADATGLAGGIPTSTDTLPDGTLQGTNDHKNIGYNGPCPPPVVQSYTAYQYGRAAPKQPPHTFEFTIFALDTELGLSPGATNAELVSAMEGHILAQAVTQGKYTTSVDRKIVGTE